MPVRLSRRAFTAAAAAVIAAPHVRRAGAAEPMQLRCSLDTAPSHPRNVAFRDFLPKIEKASDGQIQTKLFESGSLFPDLQVVKALVQGQVEMVCPGTWTVTGFVPDADFSQLPAFYGLPIDVVHRATDGSAGKFVNDKVTSKLGVEVLGNWFDLGFNQWYSTKKDLTGLDSLKDMKIRSPGGVLNSWRIRFFGGIPNVTAWPDVPLAMSQGTFDGLISTNESVNSAKLVDSGLHHSMQDNMGMGLYVPMMNRAFWAKLDPKLQQAIQQLWKDSLPGYRENTAKAQQGGREALTKAGVTFVDVPQADLDATRKKMLAEQEKVAADSHMSPELVKLVMADVSA
ncbi:MAG: TRAP transporter substrate-binding protein DctP [Alphaproteobacteria bacterium]|nr:TRAP transporter substrate-binding protein DctP [Alphaproteobacteria bacterium]